MIAYIEPVKLVLAAAGIVAALGAAAVVALSSEPQPSAPAGEQVAPEAPQPVSAQGARELLASGALLADVREPRELAETGKLKTAVNVPLTRLKQLAAQGSTPAELERAKDRPVILYCRSGRRSGEAGQILLRQGFTRVYNLGGFEDAVKAGLSAA